MNPGELRRRIFLTFLGSLSIGIWGFQVWDSSQKDDHKPRIGIPQASETYSEAVRSAGGEPVMLSYDSSQISRHIKNLDGILFPGGADIDPAIYGEEKHPTVKVVHPDRYEFESKLARAWLDQTEKPFLGICLGCQMLNVIQGGSLIQDIPSTLGTNHRKNHSIQVDLNSKLYSILEASNVEVNSNHHQAVKQIGDGLVITAQSPEDGVIEAIEGVGERFVVGVQWHPEQLTSDDKQKRIFEEFVQAAARLKTLGSE